ncbi:MAG: S8 family serine peptidase [Deinococcales bacterium]
MMPGRYLPALISFLFVTLLTACELQLPVLNVEVAKNPLSITSGEGTFTIRNTADNNSNLKWFIETTADWLRVSQREGEILAGGLTQIRLGLKANLGVGSYEGNLTVNGQDVLPITINVKADVIGCANLQTLSRPITPAYQEGLEYVPNQVLIRYREGLSTQASIQADLSKRYDLTLIETRGQMSVMHTDDPVMMAQKLSQEPNILYAQPNYYLHTLANPNDSLYSEQWHLSQFGLPQAWDKIDVLQQRSQESVVVAVIDSGVDIVHEDLLDNMLAGCDFFDSDSDPKSPTDPHGTHVSGIIAATTNNAKGVAGVAGNANVMILPLKIFDDSGRTATSEVAANAIRWAAGLFVEGFNSNPTPAQILNLSVGRPGDDEILNEAIADAAAAGVLVFAASGNYGKNNGIFSPANAPEAIAVGSVDSDLGRSSFSNYDNTGTKTVDLVAPGGTLLSGKPSRCTNTGQPFYIVSTFPNNNYACLSGTSMATPFVSGVAALVWSQNRTWTADQVKDRLYRSTRLDSNWDASEYGKGVICADKALGADSLCGQ